MSATPTTTTFGYTGAIQTYDVSSNGIYQIVAAGAPGGMIDYGDQTFFGNMGAKVTATFNLSAGSTLGVVVGGAGGQNFNGAAGGGGGGSFVYKTAANGLPTLLAVGGGGGGAGLNVYTSNPFPVNSNSALYGSSPVFVAPVINEIGVVVDTTNWPLSLGLGSAPDDFTDWVVSATGGTGFNPGAAGYNFQGGTGATMPFAGAGGGGWKSAGTSSATSTNWLDTTPSSGGGGLAEGFVGGVSGKNFGVSYGGNGGFGGGGAGENIGGGGGYTGGGGGGSYGYGGNGGSYVSSSALNEKIQQGLVSSTGQCNTICINHQEVLNGKDGTTWAIRSGEIRAMAQMAGRPEPDRHWFSPR